MPGAFALTAAEAAALGAGVADAAVVGGGLAAAGGTAADLAAAGASAADVAGALGAGTAFQPAFTAASTGLLGTVGNAFGQVGSAASSLYNSTLGADGLGVTGNVGGASAGTGAPGASSLPPTTNPADVSSVSTAGGAGSAAQGALSAGKGLSKTSIALGALAALAGAISKPKAGAGLPGPASTAATSGPYFTMAPTNSGYINRAPTNTASMTPQQWQTYGQNPGGEQRFFQGNQLTFAEGGEVEPGDDTAVFATGGGEHHVRGPGAGQDDKVNAVLSDGEFVFDAGTVSAIGDGSNEAGARRLDEMRKAIANDKGFEHVVQPKMKKSPLEYLREAR